MALYGSPLASAPLATQTANANIPASSAGSVTGSASVTAPGNDTFSSSGSINTIAAISGSSLVGELSSGSIAATAAVSGQGSSVTGGQSAGHIGGGCTMSGADISIAASSGGVIVTASVNGTTGGGDATDGHINGSVVIASGSTALSFSSGLITSSASISGGSSSAQAASSSGAPLASAPLGMQTTGTGAFQQPISGQATVSGTLLAIADLQGNITGQARVTGGGSTTGSVSSGAIATGASAYGQSSHTVSSPMLPAGALYTSGNQIVDGNGNPQRINAINWNGTEWNAASIMFINVGDAATGNTFNYQQMLQAMVQCGFNAFRLETDDQSILNDTVMTGIDGTVNADLVGLTYLQVITKIVTYAGTLGLRAIIDSHSNAGGTGQQNNGLWYGQGVNNATGQPLTSADFTARWQKVATALKGNAGLLGYDIRNEPLSAASVSPYPAACTWGDGGTNDIRGMYQTVGNAIQAIDPTPLIICEGVQNYSGTNFAGQSGNAPEGDLSKVIDQSAPVVLNTPNKVVYSIHCYPPNVSGSTANPSEWMQNWAEVYSKNLAPVWIGECGDRMSDSTDTAWASTFCSFLNGSYSGGPTVAPGNQPMGAAWYCWGVSIQPGQIPDFGVATSVLPPSSVQSAQQPYVRQLAPIGNSNNTAGATGANATVSGTGAAQVSAGGQIAATALVSGVVHGIASSASGGAITGSTTVRSGAIVQVRTVGTVVGTCTVVSFGAGSAGGSIIATAIVSGAITVLNATSGAISGQTTVRGYLKQASAGGLAGPIISWFFR